MTTLLSNDDENKIRECVTALIEQLPNGSNCNPAARIYSILSKPKKPVERDGHGDSQRDRDLREISYQEERSE